MSTMKLFRTIFYLVIILIGVLAPWFFYPIFLMKILCFALFAAAFNLLLGYTGLLSFGHAAFFGGSGYALGFFMRNAGLSPELGIILGTTFAACLGAAMGGLAIRRQGIYFSMITLALAQMLRSVVKITAYREVTGGDDGLTMNWTGNFFGLTQAELARPANFWTVAWLALCGVMLLAWWVGHSRTGEILRATKANEERMRFSGFNTYVPRVLAFGLAGFIAAVSGLLLGLHTAFASPELLDFTTGANSLVSMLIGGASMVTGPILGALLYTVGQDQFGASGHLELLTGLGVVVVVLAFPKGAIGFLQSGIDRFTGRKHASN